MAFLKRSPHAFTASLLGKGVEVFQASRTVDFGRVAGSHRYAWAERAKVAGYPERFAQEALGHNSKAASGVREKGASDSAGVGGV